MGRRYHFLLNRASGGTERGLDATAIVRLVDSTFREYGHEVTSTLIRPKGLDRALDKAFATKPDAVIVGGGDGTVSAAAQRFGGSSVALGILPIGTFNLAARDFGVPLQLEEAVRFLAAAEPLSIDVLDVSGYACLCTTVLGFYPEFAKTFEHRDYGGHWWKKALNVFVRLPAFFSRARPLHLAWRSDQGEGSARTKFSAFVPGRYKAAAGILPVRTDFNSGSLTAYIGTQNDARAALRGLLDYVFGRQEQNPELLSFQTSRLELRDRSRQSCVLMLDGEILRMRFPLKLSIKRGHLHVLTTPENIASETGTDA